MSRFLIGIKNNRNLGYGSRALRKVIRFAYNKLGVENLFLRVFDFNKNAIKCYEKMGFVKIKFIENARQTGNDSWNAYVMERKI